MPIINLFPATNAFTPIEQALTAAYKSFNVPALGGASVNGWSKLYDFQRCPYRYNLLHNQQELLELSSVSKPASLELGSMLHSMLAMHYIRSMPTAKYNVATDAGRIAWPTPYALAERVISLEANPAIVDEARRLYSAYFNHYGNAETEGWQPLAIELDAGDPRIHTCRFDMVARINGGVWIVEHKTASRESRDVIEGWWLDGEILGEVYGYRLSQLNEVYGPLVGVLVNIVVKTQVPKFRRVEVVVTDEVLKQYAQDSLYWRSERYKCSRENRWPKKLAGCIGRYDTCAFFDHCRDADNTDSDRLKRMLELSLKG
jgi:hypothetical protein